MTPDDYLPLYAEKRCLVCGFWRGQHEGASTEDVEMRCPTTFVPSTSMNPEEQ